MKKWRNLFIITLGLSFGAICAGACASKQALAVHAEGEEVVSSSSEDEEQGWVKKSYETYIVPLLSGVSITSVVSLLACVATTLIKNKLLDKKLLALQEKQKEEQAKVDEKYQLTCQKLEEVTETLRVINDVKTAITEDKQINEEIKTFIIERITYITQKIDENSLEVAKIEKLQKVLNLLVELEVKVAQQSQNIVKSGIVEDIKQITQLIKEI